jgi:Zn-dependent alcohol dehydrogenase
MAEMIMVDMEDKRPEMSSHLGVTAVINNKDGKAVGKIMKMTDDRDNAVAPDRSQASDHWTTSIFCGDCRHAAAWIGHIRTANTAALIS